MKRLWAPWRLEYIQEGKEDGCFLCRILAGEADREDLVLKRASVCAIVMNRYPYTNGHLMICPYRHIADVGLMTADERLQTMDLLSDAMDALRATIKPEGFNVGVNIGKAGGAGLEEHVHMHLVPRWDGDTNFITVMDDVRVVPQALGELWECLHPVLNA